MKAALTAFAVIFAAGILYSCNEDNESLPHQTENEAVTEEPEPEPTSETAPADTYDVSDTSELKDTANT